MGLGHLGKNWGTQKYIDATGETEVGYVGRRQGQGYTRCSRGAASAHA
jgi:hypothetical protein